MTDAGWIEGPPPLDVWPARYDCVLSGGCARNALTIKSPSEIEWDGDDAKEIPERFARVVMGHVARHFRIPDPEPQP